MSQRSRVLSRFCLIAFSIFILGIFAFADSQVRMVRLSLADGNVEAGHHLSPNYQKAFLNVPIVQGMTLRTGEGRAEVEFEDGSTVRLGPQTLVEFTTLSRRDSGALVSAITVDQGITYIDCRGDDYVKLSGGALSGSKRDEFSILLGNEAIRPAEKAHFRVLRNSGKAEVAVFSGEVALQGPTENFEAGKKQTLLLDLSANKFQVEKKLPAFLLMTGTSNRPSITTAIL